MDIHIKPLDALKSVCYREVTEEKISFFSCKQRGKSLIVALTGILMLPVALILVIDKIVRFAKACFKKEVAVAKKDQYGDFVKDSKNEKIYEKKLETKKVAAIKLGESCLSLIILPLAGGVSAIVRGIAGFLFHPIFSIESSSNSIRA